MNITTFFFEAFDEAWKGDPNNSMGAEKNRGLYSNERKPKKVMHEYNCNQGKHLIGYGGED